LRCLVRQQPEWTQAECAACLGRSRSWVKTWRARLKAHAPDDLAALQARSRARHTPQPTTPPAVVDRILSLRDEPKDALATGAWSESDPVLFAARPRGSGAGRALATVHPHHLEDPAPARPHRPGPAPAPSTVGAPGSLRGSADGRATRRRITGVVEPVLQPRPVSKACSRLSTQHQQWGWVKREEKPKERPNHPDNPGERKSGRMNASEPLRRLR
jgi:hypothetical protein